MGRENDDYLDSSLQKSVKLAMGLVTAGMIAKAAVDGWKKGVDRQNKNYEENLRMTKQAMDMRM